MPWKPETWGAWTQKVCGFITAAHHTGCVRSEITLFWTNILQHFIPYLVWEFVNIMPSVVWNVRYWLRAKTSVHPVCCHYRHRSADHHQWHGDPHITADPWDAGGFLPVPGVRLQHPSGGGPRTHRWAGCVSPLQQRPQPGTRSQSLYVLRQTDGES